VGNEKVKDQIGSCTELVRDVRVAVSFCPPAQRPRKEAGVARRKRGSLFMSSQPEGSRSGCRGQQNERSSGAKRGNRRRNERRKRRRQKTTFGKLTSPRPVRGWVWLNGQQVVRGGGAPGKACLGKLARQATCVIPRRAVKDEGNGVGELVTSLTCRTPGGEALCFWSRRRGKNLPTLLRVG